MSAILRKLHDHVDGRCGQCFADGEGVGHEDGYEDGAESANGRADRVIDDVRSALVEAHRNAKHGGRWEVCTDVVCAEMERWLHFETRPEAVAPRAPKRLAVVAT